MSYKIRIESFEGPFDLLLYLVNRQKVDIGAISVTEIADQYLSEVTRMKNLDLDVASDFLVVASTLLEIKAASLLPQKRSSVEEEFEEIAPNAARDILIERLLRYKTYKNAAASLQTRFISESRMHARPFGPEVQFLNLMPDYLKNIELDTLAQVCANSYARRDVFLLEAEHIAAKPIPVEVHVRSIHKRIVGEKHLRFSDLVTEKTPTPALVAIFLALLELYKRSMITITQEQSFGDIEVDYIEGSGELIIDNEGLTSVEE